MPRLKKSLDFLLGMVHMHAMKNATNIFKWFFFIFYITTLKSEASQQTTVIISNISSTIVSPNHTFELGFFTLNSNSSYYLGIWYATIPIRTYVWLANRRSPLHNPGDLSISSTGQLIITDRSSNSVVWSSQNTHPATTYNFLDSGNLVLRTSEDTVAWQSFDFPTDTWLPNMTVTNLKPFVSWKSPVDPSPGMYMLRLEPPEYGQFELVYNGSVKYWSTGDWVGNRFAGVPEMTVPYIYSFQFLNPFTPDASFVYSETPAIDKMLTRFVVDSSGQVMQYTWSQQASSWNMFWSRPESGCRVYGRCGNLGFCNEGLRPCECVGGTQPVDADAWSSGDFSGGCGNVVDGYWHHDVFEDVGRFDFDGAVLKLVSSVASREACEESCRTNISCFGIRYVEEIEHCFNLYGNAFNLRNTTTSPILYLRVSLPSPKKPTGKLKIVAIVAGCMLTVLVLIVSIIAIMLVWRSRRRGKCKESIDDEEEDAMNLKVFAYKELSTATNSFSDKLGHGGFGAVFLGKLPDSTAVAVKRLERPNGGDREFRAEVRTIGSIHHVNLVRLHGFCSEDPHRLLVYEYMPNGSLSTYLNHKSNNNRTILSWQVRIQIAIGIAKGIAYLHEECRDCIIHCDIKPENILLDTNFTPKVSDFGLAKLIGRDFSRVLATMRGTWGYVAPEWISGVAITTKADVYSYGMTLLELIGGRRNVETPQSENDGWFFPPIAAQKIVDGYITEVVDPMLCEEYDMIEVERASKVAVWCIQDEETERPSMSMVVKMLMGTVAVTTPHLPQLLQALVSGDSFARGGSDS